MFDYLNQQKLDEVSITQNILQQKSILGDDPLSLSMNLTEIIKNSRIYLTYIFILTLVFTSSMWLISGNLIHRRSFRKLRNNYSKIFIVSAFYLGIILLFFYSVLNISFTEAAYNSVALFGKYLTFFFISIILFYFMFISLSLINKTELTDIVQKTLSIGLRKIHYMLSVYFINIFFISAPLFLLIYFNETGFLIPAFALILIVFGFLFSRIFILNVVEKLNESS